MFGGIEFHAERSASFTHSSESSLLSSILSAWNSIPPNRPKYLNLFLAKLTRNRALDRIKAENAKKRGGSEVNLIYEELSDEADRFLKNVMKHSKVYRAAEL